MKVKAISITKTSAPPDAIVCFTFQDGYEFELLAFRPIDSDQASWVRLTDPKQRNHTGALYNLQVSRGAANSFEYISKLKPKKFADYWQTALDHIRKLPYQTINGVRSDKVRALLESTQPYLEFLKKNHC